MQDACQVVELFGMAFARECATQSQGRDTILYLDPLIQRDTFNDRCSMQARSMPKHEATEI